MYYVLFVTCWLLLLLVEYRANYLVDYYFACNSTTFALKFVNIADIARLCVSFKL